MGPDSYGLERLISNAAKRNLETTEMDLFEVRWNKANLFRVSNYFLYIEFFKIKIGFSVLKKIFYITAGKIEPVT